MIELLRGNARIKALAANLRAAGTRSFCTAVTWAEVYAGIKPGDAPATHAFFEARGEVVLDSYTGRRAGEYLARYAPSHGLEVPDALIAAAASTTGMLLWTLNRRHYPMEDVRFFPADAAG